MLHLKYFVFPIILWNTRFNNYEIYEGICLNLSRFQGQIENVYCSQDNRINMLTDHDSGKAAVI